MSELLSGLCGRCGKPLGRIALVIARSTPEYMIVYALVILLGPWMLPAIIALSVQSGAIVGCPLGQRPDTFGYSPDAPKGMSLYFYETVPRMYGQFLDYILYQWGIILDESAI